MHGRAPPCGAPSCGALPRPPTPSSSPRSVAPAANGPDPIPDHPSRFQRRHRLVQPGKTPPLQRSLYLALLFLACTLGASCANASSSSSSSSSSPSDSIFSAAHPDEPPPQNPTVPRAFLLARAAAAAPGVAPPPPIDVAYALPKQRPVRGGGWVRRGSLDPANLSRVRGRGIAREVFNAAASGKRLELTFNLAPGSYDVTLGFIEPYFPNCKLGSRVFSVAINGNVRLPALDIFATAGCNSAFVRTFSRQTVDRLKRRPLSIVLTGLVGKAVVSYVRIKLSAAQCMPQMTRGVVKADHVAHAIPGVYPPTLGTTGGGGGGPTSYVDNVGRGFVWVTIDGRGSHTHFVDAVRGSGRITRYRWVNVETGKVVSTRATFRYKFMLGTTRLRLEVLDTVCSSDEAETSITVTSQVQDGAYCYYYKGQPALPGPGTLFNPNVRPTFAAAQKTIDFNFPKFDFADSQFVVRCIFFLNTMDSDSTEFHIVTGGTGDARLYRKGVLLIDTRAGAKKNSPTLAGLTPYELIYRRGAVGVRPVLKLRLGGWVPAPSKVSHDQTHVLPIITAIDPPSGSVSGGVRTRIAGYGLFLPATIMFGRKRGRVIEAGSTRNSVYVSTPPGNGKGDVHMRFESASGLRSNMLKYSYGIGCDPIDFEQLELTNRAGATIDLKQPTTAILWQDGRLYVGTYGGLVQVVSYNAKTMRATNMCHSEYMSDPRFRGAGGGIPRRAILGITFDPRDTVARPYVSTSTLFHIKYKAIDPKKYSGGWRNGAVEQLMPATRAVRARDPRRCLQWRRRVVTNLPVGNSDHAVNALEFTQNGDLLIAIGGHTNAGLPNVRTGGTWESYFSSAVVVARMSRPDYNGVIRYTSDNPRTARPISGDVELFATGLRNTFAMNMLRDGSVFAADNGANCEFGNASTWCGLYKEAEASRRSVASKAGVASDAVVRGRAFCPGRYEGHNPQSHDKFVRLMEGRFYGHANLMRAPRECMWINPYTGRGAAYPGGRAAPGHYTPPTALLKSPVTGFVEYGARHFCGRLRGEIVTSSYNGQRSLRIRLPRGGRRGAVRMSAKDVGEEEEEEMEVNEDAEPDVDADLPEEVTRMWGGKPRVDLLWPTSGLTVVEDIHGQLIFPKISTREVVVLRPRVSAWRRRNGRVFVANALPARHGINGGSRLRIGGWGFGGGRAVAVKVGKGNCRVIAVIADESIVCVVPPGPPDALVDVVAVVDGQTQRLSAAVKYMRV